MFMDCVTSKPFLDVSMNSGIDSSDIQHRLNKPLWPSWRNLTADEVQDNPLSLALTGEIDEPERITRNQWQR